MRQRIEHYLEIQPKARERTNKYRAIANILIQKYQIDIPKDKLEEIVFDAVASDRYWRLILKERPELRGSDYGDKELLVEKAKAHLGYSSFSLGANQTKSLGI